MSRRLLVLNSKFLHSIQCQSIREFIWSVEFRFAQNGICHKIPFISVANTNTPSCSRSSGRSHCWLKNGKMQNILYFENHRRYRKYAPSVYILINIPTNYKIDIKQFCWIFTVIRCHSQWSAVYQLALALSELNFNFEMPKDKNQRFEIKQCHFQMDAFLPPILQKSFNIFFEYRFLHFNDSIQWRKFGNFLDDFDRRQTANRKLFLNLL